MKAGNITEQELKVVINDIDNQINDLQEKRKEVIADYCQARAEFKIGDAVQYWPQNKKTSKSIHCIVEGHVLPNAPYNSTHIRYVLRRIKKDGDLSVQCYGNDGIGVARKILNIVYITKVES